MWVDVTARRGSARRPPRVSCSAMSEVPTHEGRKAMRTKLGLVGIFGAAVLATACSGGEGDADSGTGGSATTGGAGNADGSGATTATGAAPSSGGSSSGSGGGNEAGNAG